MLFGSIKNQIFKKKKTNGVAGRYFFFPKPSWQYKSMDSLTKGIATRKLFIILRRQYWNSLAGKA